MLDTLYLAYQVGIYAACVERLLNTCVIPVHTLCAKSALMQQGFFVLEGAKAFVRLALAR